MRKLAEILGCSPERAKLLVVGFVLLLAVGIYFAAVAAVQLKDEYLGGNNIEEIGEDVEDSILQRRRELKKRAKLPTLLDEGTVVPDAPLRPDGTFLKCGPELSGRSGLLRGWVWNPEEERCRRIAIGIGEIRQDAN